MIAVCEYITSLMASVLHAELTGALCLFGMPINKHALSWESKQSDKFPIKVCTEMEGDDTLLGNKGRRSCSYSSNAKTNIDLG